MRNRPAPAKGDDLILKRWNVLLATALLVSVGVFGATKALTVGEGKRPALASDEEGRLHLAYQGLKAGDNIYYRQSSDGGHSWSEESNISGTPDKSSHPCIAAAGNRVAVAWLEDCRDHSGNDVYLSTSADGGKSWGKAIDVSHTPGQSAYPTVAVGPHGSIHVAWSDTTEGKGKPDIFYSSSDNGGASWTKVVNVSNTHGVFGPPTMAIGANELVHIAWSDNCSGPSRPDIHAVRGMQDSWSTPLAVSDTHNVSSHPGLTLSPGGRACVAWLEDCRDHAGNDIYFAHADEGSTYSRPFDLSRTPGVSGDPSVASDNQGNVAVTWVDTTSNRKAPDVWLARSANRGQTFSPSTNLSHTPGVAHEPRAAMLNGKPVVVWEEVVRGRSTIKVAPVKVEP